MTEPPAQRARRPTRRAQRWEILAVAVLVLAAGSLITALRGDQSGDDSGPPVVERSADVIPPPGPARPRRIARSVPVSLRIPAIDVTATVSKVGLEPDGTVEEPEDYDEAGWFRQGPSPGQVGSAVILGHVDSRSGPAVFYRLRTLREGDEVEVRLANGVVTVFAVTKVETYLKTEFPARRVYASQGFSALQIVTCGGTFDAAKGSYRSNVVAYTRLKATREGAG